jgi:hypothetical protein
LNISAGGWQGQLDKNIELIAVIGIACFSESIHPNSLHFGRSSLLGSLITLLATP